MSEWQGVQRLLVAYLGEREGVRDLLPALRRLQAALPGARLSWLGAARALPIDPAFPSFDRMIVCRHKSGARLDNPQHEMWLVDRVQRENFDGAIVFTRPGESPWLIGYICYLAGVPLRAGQSVEFGGGVLSHAIEPPAEGEDRHLALLAALGLEVKD